MKGIRTLLINGKELIPRGEQGILELEEYMVRGMLEIEEDAEIIGDFPSAEEVLRQTEILSPNIVLMEAKMPGIVGPETIRRLHQIWPQCRVIMITWHRDYLAEALEAGVAGYLLKDIDCQELAQVIIRVYKGESVIDERLILTPQGVQDKADNWELEYLPPEGDVPVTLIKKIKLCIPPPLDAARLLRFIFQVEGWLDANIVQQAGSCHKGVTITILLNRAAPLFGILDRLGKMPEVDRVSEEPGIEQKSSSFPNKTIFTTETRPQKEITVTLNQASPAKQLELARPRIS